MQPSIVPRASVAPMLIGGSIAAIGGTIYSIIDAPFSAVRANKKHRRKLSLTPAPIQEPSQSTGWGAQLQMTL